MRKLIELVKKGEQDMIAVTIAENLLEITSNTDKDDIYNSTLWVYPRPLGRIKTIRI